MCRLQLIMKDSSAEAVTTTLVSEYLPRFDVPLTVTTDCEMQFELTLSHNLAKFLRSNRTRTTVQWDGRKVSPTVESGNYGTIIEFFVSSSENDPVDPPKCVDRLKYVFSAHVQNCALILLNKTYMINKNLS